MGADGTGLQRNGGRAPDTGRYWTTSPGGSCPHGPVPTHLQTRSPCSPVTTGPRPEPPGTAAPLFCVGPGLGPEPLTPPLGLRVSRRYHCGRLVIRAAGTACGCSPSKYVPGQRAVPGTPAALWASVQEGSLLRGTVRQVNAMKPHSPERRASGMHGTAGSNRELPGADSGRATDENGRLL